MRLYRMRSLLRPIFEVQVLALGAPADVDAVLVVDGLCREGRSFGGSLRRHKRGRPGNTANEVSRTNFDLRPIVATRWTV